MKRSLSWVIIAIALIIVGMLVLVGCSFNIFGNGDFVNSLESKEYAVVGEFDSISAELITDNFTMKVSEDGVTKVVCLEEEGVTHTVEVVEGVLKIKAEDDRAWFEHIGIFFKSPSVTLYVPEKAFKSLDIDVKTGAVDLTEEFSFERVNIEGDTSAVKCGAKVQKSVDIKTATGAIKLHDLNVERIELSADTGAIDIENVNCDSLRIENDTGAVKLEKVISSGELYVENDTGGVKLERCDGGNITLKTSTGGIKATLLSNKSFDVDVTTGSANYPKDTTGGQCKVRTTTGSVDIEIVK